MTHTRFTTSEHCFCPRCSKPLVVLRGHNAEGKPIALPTHRIDLRSFRPGTHRIAA